MLKKIVGLFLLAALIVGSMMTYKGCSDGVEVEDREVVVVSILPVKFIVDRVSGGMFPVEVLVPAGASPESYEPTPRQLKSVSGAQCIFSTGLLDFERELVGRLEGNSEVSVVELSKGIDLLGGTCSHGHSHAHTHGADPHIWSSPSRLKLMAERVCEALALLHPESAAGFRANLDELCVELDILDCEIRSAIEGAELKSFLIYHPALTYYADDYGIEQIVVEYEGKEPSAVSLQNTVDMARREGITNILYQREFSRSITETLAADLGAEIIEIDPLAPDVIENLRRVTNLLTGR